MIITIHKEVQIEKKFTSQNVFCKLWRVTMPVSLLTNKTAHKHKYVWLERERENREEV